MNQDKKDLIVKVETAIISCFAEYEVSDEQKEQIHASAKLVTKSILKDTKKALKAEQKKEEQRFKMLKKKAKPAKVEAWVAPLEEK